MLFVTRETPWFLVDGTLTAAWRGPVRESGRGSAMKFRIRRKKKKPLATFNPEWNYKRLDSGDVFTGKQANNLMELAGPAYQAMLLLCLERTDEPAMFDSKYGFASE